MKPLLIASILFFIPLGAFADERQRQIEYEAINLVIKKYGKGLENRLKGTELNPNYRSWYENDCFLWQIFQKGQDPLFLNVAKLKVVLVPSFTFNYFSRIRTDINAKPLH